MAEPARFPLWRYTVLIGVALYSVGSAWPTITQLLVPSTLVDAGQRWTILAEFATFIAFLGVGSWLVVIRPGGMTWGFYWYLINWRAPLIGPDLTLGHFGPDAVAQTLVDGLGGAGLVGVIDFALRFPYDRVEGWRKSWARVTPYAYAPVALINMAWDVAYCFGWPHRNVLVLVWATCIATCFVIATAILLVTYREAHGDARQRLLWIAVLPVAFAVQAARFATAFGLFGLDLPPALSDDLVLASIVVPITVAYAVIRHRIFDVSFALNRTAVFSGVSIVIVGTFVLVEWLLGGWLLGQSHTTNIVVGAALALGLGLSVHVVHRWVDRAVDNLFFRKRHNDEKALRRFANEATYITDAATLLQRASEVLERHADASFVTIAIADGAGSYGGVSENDPAILSLRANHDVVDLHTRRSALNGEFAFPMVARGRLVGALVLGPKESGEPYAPDEAEAIALLAHGVAVGLDVLAVRGDGGRDVALDVIEALPAALREANHALADEIVQRLRRAGVHG